VRPGGTVDWFRAERVRGLEFREKPAAPELPREEPTVALEEGPEAPDAQATTDRTAVLAGHIEALALRGFHVRALAGESIEGVVTQSFVDTLRGSVPAAILGRRGVFVLTSRRAFIVHATLGRKSIECVYLDRIDRIGFGTRTAWRWFAIGFTVMLFASLLLVLPVLRIGWMGAPTGPLPVVEAAISLAIGMVLVLLSRYRALELGIASGSVPFGQSALESDAISSIDGLRERAIQRSSEVRASAQSS
jgi:hypothetical protein